MSLLIDPKNDKWTPKDIKPKNVSAPIVNRELVKSKSEKVAEEHRAIFGDLMPAHRILKEVVADTGVLAEDLLSIYRAKVVVEARAILYYRLRAETKMTFQEIARFCKRDDHSTIIKVVKRYCKKFNIPVPREGVLPRKENVMDRLWWVQVKGCDPEPARVTERNGHRYAKIIGWEQEIPEGTNLRLLSIIEHVPVIYSTSVEVKEEQ
jgi:hypothetical protein